MIQWQGHVVPILERYVPDSLYQEFAALVLDQPFVQETLRQDVRAAWDARYPMLAEELALSAVPSDASSWVKDAHQAGLVLEYQATSLNPDKIVTFPKFVFNLLQCFNYVSIGKYLEALKKRKFKLDKDYTMSIIKNKMEKNIIKLKNSNSKKNFGY